MFQLPVAMPSMQAKVGKQPMYVEICEQLLRSVATPSLTVWAVSAALHVAMSETEHIINKLYALGHYEGLCSAYIHDLH